MSQFNMIIDNNIMCVQINYIIQIIIYIHHNSIFQSAYKKEIIGLPDVLKHLGYELTFITKPRT